MNKAIFLDRDGVINKEVDNLHKLEDLQIIGGVSEALALLKEKGFKLIVISNQPVIARGLIDEEGVNKIHEEINRILRKQSGVEVDKFFFCPHHPNANLEKYRINCSCRKPNIGLISQAAREFDIDLSLSWMIGDRTSDVETGKRAGCKTILIENKYSKNKIQGVEYSEEIIPNFIYKNLNSAVQQIIYGNLLE